MRTNKKSVTSIARGQDAKELRRLNASFVRTMTHLKCRPEPRWRFDFVAMEAPRRNHPGEEAVIDCRTVLKAAVLTGNRDVINATRLEIAHYFDDMKDSALREVEVEGQPSLAAAVLEYHRESAEAQHAAVCAGIEKTESSEEAALRELREAEDCGESLIAVLGAELAIRQGRRHMQVAR